MERVVMPRLVEWAQKYDRKPLIIMGARQVGKTWLMREFGRNNFKDVFYLNFENTPGMDELFSGENLHAKSLRVYIEKYKPDISIRTSLRNLQYSEGLINIPLFVFFELISIISKTLENKKL